MRFVFAKNQKFLTDMDIVSVMFEKSDGGEYVREGKRRFLYIDRGKKPLTRRSFITLLRRIVGVAKKHKIKKIALSLLEFPAPKGASSFELGTLIAENFLLANFEFTQFKTRPKEGFNEVAEVMLWRADDEFKKGVRRGIIVGEETNKSRALSNTPGGDMTPTMLAENIRKACAGMGITVRVFGKKELKRLKMGAVLGVARGSVEEPKFIILEYFPLRGKRGFTRNKRGTARKNNDAPVVLVGKGVTFDTGGLNLKPTSGILDMHLDMSGGAAVAHATIAAARLKLKKNIVALIPAVENMPSGQSYRPGDILKSLSGKTIEVLNTDAEGRLILADALTYAKKYKPRLVIDVATLTSSSIAALGARASALISNDEKLRDMCLRLSEESGDYLWPFPLWDEYEEDIKGTFADVANSASMKGGDVIHAATFLRQFVKESSGKKDSYPWAHIDIAPRMTSIPSDHLAKGATGAPIRFLVKLLENH